MKITRKTEGRHELPAPIPAFDTLLGEKTTVIAYQLLPNEELGKPVLYWIVAEDHETHSAFRLPSEISFDRAG